MSTDPMVTIFCVTYNHEPYIADALEGFMMQKTDFPVECLVIDDCSTDGTLNVVRSYQEKYPGRIRVVMPPQNTKGKFAERIYAQLRGKYIAHCEGDDYWVNEYKLQKQVEYMEEHPTCACYCGNSFILDQNDLEKSRKEKRKICPVGNMDHLSVESYLEHEEYAGGTAAMLYRNFHERLPAWSYRFDFGDMFVFLQAFKHGYVHYSDEVMAVYRINVPGSYNNRINTLDLEARATKWLRYWENKCEAWQYFNIDTDYRWDEAIQKKKGHIRDFYIAKQYKILHIAQNVSKNSWKGIVSIIGDVLNVPVKQKRPLAIWGIGKSGKDLISELADRGRKCLVVDQKKGGEERPDKLFVSEEKCFVILTMMEGYREAEKTLKVQGYKECLDYICLAKYDEIWLHYNI